MAFCHVRSSLCSLGSVTFTSAIQLSSPPAVLILRSCSRRESGFLRLPPDLVLEVLLVDPGLHISGLLEATLDGVLAGSVAGTVQAVLTVGLFATGVRAAHPHPRDHATTAEAVAATALRETTLLRVEQQVAAGTGAVGFIGGVLGRCVDGVETVKVLAARLAFVLRFVAVETGLEAAVLAGEDTAVGLTVEGLEWFAWRAYLNNVPWRASFPICWKSSVDVQNMHSIWSGLFSSTCRLR
jgi:hypothetical protein